MNDMELYIAKDRPTLNPVTKAFLKGHVPYNKGRKWSQWMSRKSQLRAMKGWQNLKGRMDIGGWNARKVIMIREDGRWFVFPSASEAGRKTGIQDTNIRKTCRKERRTAGGFRWFYEDDNEWLEIINLKEKK